jgi:uncharacterized membrane protein (DUF485 family)
MTTEPSEASSDVGAGTSAAPSIPSQSAPPPAEFVDPARYLTVEASPEFAHLRRTMRGFAFPVTVAFLLWYVLYVILSAYARDFMGTKVVGNFNVAFVFGLLQFASTFVIAWLYSRFASRRIDPLADELRARVEEGGAK